MANVLVVDDAAFMRLTIKKILESNGHAMVGEASNGKEAVIQYESLRPDVVILDITMPDMNGVEALNKIKQLDPDVKVIICSAMGNQNMLAQTIECGAKDFVVKPFQPERLVAAIEKVVSK